MVEEEKELLWRIDYTVKSLESESRLKIGQLQDEIMSISKRVANMEMDMIRREGICNVAMTRLEALGDRMGACETTLRKEIQDQKESLDSHIRTGWKTLAPWIAIAGILASLATTIIILAVT